MLLVFLIQAFKKNYLGQYITVLIQLHYMNAMMCL